MKWTSPPPAPVRRMGEATITADEVVSRLEDAGRTLMRLPGSGWSTGARTYWPDIVREQMEAYGWTDAELRLGPPSAAEISAMDEALRWLGYIPEDRYVLRRIVGIRAIVHPISGRHRYTWRALGRMLHCNHMAAQRWHAEGIRFIVIGWNGAEQRAA